MSKTLSEQELNERRQSVLVAALDCFFYFGVNKTSLTEIAKQAGLSRTLLYLLFSSKEEIFEQAFAYLLQSNMEKAQSVAEQTLPDKEKLLTMMDLVFISNYQRAANSPHLSGMKDLCEYINDQAHKEFIMKLKDCANWVFKDETKSEIYAFAVAGQGDDNPKPDVLRQRIADLTVYFLK